MLDFMRQIKLNKLTIVQRVCGGIILSMLICIIQTYSLLKEANVS